MQTLERATGKDIILDIVENMRAYREELLYSTIVPTAFEVHLHPDDYTRLEGILPTIAAEARRALDEELARQNRRGGPEWLRRLTQAGAPARPAQEGWSIAFYRDESDELKPGDVLVDSRLALPAAPELGAGTRTRRITTARIAQQVTTRSEIVDGAAPSTVAPSPPVATDAAAVDGRPDARGETVKTVPARVFATLTYEDNSGVHTHPITSSHVVIGRGGVGYWVDVRLDAAPDVSREHVRLRRDDATGRFLLKDVSLYGTTVDGKRVASSIDHAGGTKKDLNVEVALPPVARIGLADLVFVDFRMIDAS